VADKNASEAKSNLSLFKFSVHLESVKKKVRVACLPVCNAVVALVDFNEDEWAFALSHASCFP
jgi:hypothetical protein